MGAQEFQIYATEATPKKAFKEAVEESLYSYGHDGYTGTIAEKSTFTMASLTIMSEAKARQLINATINTTYGDKWGPAGCIQISSTNKHLNTYIFYGWASC